MKKEIGFILYMIVFIAVFSGCSMEQEQQEKNPGNTKDIAEEKDINTYGMSIFVDNQDIYISGDYDSNLCYWKNGKRFDIAGDIKEFHVFSRIFMDKGSLYIWSSNFEAGSYWKDGIKIKTCEITPGYTVTNFTIENNKSYFSGYYMPNASAPSSSFILPFYVRNGSLEPLGTDLSPYYVYNHETGRIVVSEETIYAAGMYLEVLMENAPGASINRYSPCYWIDNTKYDLEHPGFGGSAVGIALKNDSVYCAGYYLAAVTPHIIYAPCYWKDGIRTTLDDGTLDLRVTDIYVVDDQTVYTIGEGHRGKVYYWKNSDIRELPIDEHMEQPSVTSLFVKNNTVYIAGDVMDTNMTPSRRRACYWIDYAADGLDIEFAVLD